MGACTLVATTTTPTAPIRAPSTHVLRAGLSVG
jgi:hypothetical protein